MEILPLEVLFNFNFVSDGARPSILATLHPFQDSVNYTAQIMGP
jgi:hypothetical protein